MSPCTDSHIVLVGMMGAGKSSVGRALARRLDRQLFDSDEMIEERAGSHRARDLVDDGEPAFRALETDVLRRCDRRSRRRRSSPLPAASC